MGLGDFFQYPTDKQYPALTPYNPNSYATTKGSALYQARFRIALAGYAGTDAGCAGLYQRERH